MSGNIITKFENIFNFVLFDLIILNIYLYYKIFLYDHLLDYRVHYRSFNNRIVHIHYFEIYDSILL